MYEFARLSPANSYIVPSDPEPPRECDVVVIGAGIVGLAVARELAFRHDGIGVVVLEREPRIAAHQTGRSSGVIHAGIYYAPGSLKARLCVEGARELYAYCGERGIPAKRIGKVIVATRGDELPRLGELERRALANGVPGVERVGPDRLRDLEPRASGVAALYSPHTGVVDFRRVAGAFAEEVVAARGTISSSCGVSALRPDDSGILVEHARGATRARAVVACAGAWSDRLAASAGADTDPRIVPFRGAYMRLRADRRDLVRSNIYPVPDPELPFLGAHFTRTIDGEILLGPSALLVGARDAYELHRIRPRDQQRSAGPKPGQLHLHGRKQGGSHHQRVGSEDKEDRTAHGNGQRRPGGRGRLVHRGGGVREVRSRGTNPTAARSTCRPERSHPSNMSAPPSNGCWTVKFPAPMTGSSNNHLFPPSTDTR